MKKKYEFIFITLVYRDTTDILEFISSVKEKFDNYRIVIVNAHYNKETDDILNELANKNDCDIINIANGGYGYGNNKGIEYANNHYIYEYLIIANPDTLVEYVDLNAVRKIKKSVIAPVIKNLRGKNQNPYWVKEFPLGEWLIYKGCVWDKKYIRYIGYLLNKIIRETFLLSVKNKDKYTKKIFASHGSFVILSRNVIRKFDELYDDKMFMFAEEADLAHRLKKKKINIYFTNSIIVRHKEDGCIKKSKINEDEIYKKSVIYYYEKLKNK